MRIRRFHAPDMRTALRLVREEQGEQAVILSSERCGDGIEVVAATDYDEALVQRALRGDVPAPPVPPPLPPGFEDFASLLTPRPSPAFAADAPSSPVRAAAPLTALHEAALPDALMARLIDPPAAPAAASIGKRPRPPGAARFAIDGEAAAAAEAATAPRIELPSTPVAACAPVPSDDADAHVADAPAPIARAQFAESADTAAPAPAVTLRAVADPDPAVEAMRAELAQMRALIEREMGHFTDERLRGVPVRGEVLAELERYGCDAALARSIAAAIPPDMVLGCARGRALALLAKSLVVPEREPIDDGGVIALVGPTGVGKTTTLAKLAARYAERHRARDVALVTLDGYRIGAREQLAGFGRRLGMPVFEAGGEQSLADVLTRLEDYPLVLVDTAGLGQRDRALATQFNWISAARRVRSYLVLPANACAEDLDEVVRRFRVAAPEGAVLTKVDETGRLGGALSVLVRQRLPLAYVADGQRVPEDIDRAHAHRLVMRLGELSRAAAEPTEGDRHVAA